MDKIHRIESTFVLKTILLQQKTREKSLREAKRLCFKTQPEFLSSLFFTKTCDFAEM
jgi:hypothetical protein